MAMARAPETECHWSSVAVASDGRVFLRDEDSLRILIYDGKGEYLGAYEMTGGLHTARPMTVSSDGDVPYSEVLVGRDDPNRVFVTGMQGHGEKGRRATRSWRRSTRPSFPGSCRRPMEDRR